MKGKFTIEVLALNDHVVNPRFTIGNAVIDQPEDYRINIENVDNNRKQKRYITRLKSVLAQGNRKEEYAALVSTTILLDDNFMEIERALKEKRRCDAELEALQVELVFCAPI